MKRSAGPKDRSHLLELEALLSLLKRVVPAWPLLSLSRPI